MVSFVCNACGQSVRKNQVEKHYQTVCRNCEVLSCIDCGKDFHGGEYAAHTSCISEAEKYQGKLFKPKDKQNKGEQKQQQWIKQVQEASNSGTVDPQIKRLLHRLKQYSNIPRKKAKFQNFCKNSVNEQNQETLDRLWDVFSGGSKETADKNSNLENNETEESETGKNLTSQENEKITGNIDEPTGQRISKKKKRKDRKHKDSEEIDEGRSKKKGKKLKEDIACSNKGSMDKKTKKKKRKRSESEESETSKDQDPSCTKKRKGSDEENGMKEEPVIEEQQQGKFNWSSIIKKVLKEAPDNELAVKKLRKKVLAEFESRGANTKSFTDNELRALFDKKINKNPSIRVHKEKAKLRR